MGKIYQNLNGEKKYLEEDEVTDFDIPFSNLARKIVLKSDNDIKYYPCIDEKRLNEKVIKNNLKNGFLPFNHNVANMIAEQYSFCPYCGEDIDINMHTPIIIWDSSNTLKNVAEDNLCVAKPITCPHCGHESHFYYDIYANDDEKRNFMISTAKEGSAIYLKLRYIINNDKNAYIPILFYMKQFKAFFDEKEKSKKSIYFAEQEMDKSDIKKTLTEKSDKEILRILFNERIQEALETPTNKLKGNMKIELKPVELGSYSKYVTKKDYELIKIYEDINDDAEKLKQLILDK